MHLRRAGAPLKETRLLNTGQQIRCFDSTLSFNHSMDFRPPRRLHIRAGLQGEWPGYPAYPARRADT